MLSLPLDLALYARRSLAVVQMGGGAARREGEFVARSIEGRFGGDNGYFTVFVESGWLGLVGWVSLLLLLAGISCYFLWSRKDPAAGYALAAGAGGAISGVLLNSFQLFPVWVFVAFGLAAVIVNVIAVQKRKPELNNEAGEAGFSRKPA
jgi:O-antigen ligase